MNNDLLNRPNVRRVADALAVTGSASQIIALSDTARTAEDAAASLNCELGAIVKSLVFRIDLQPVMVLIAGDRRCDIKMLAAAFGNPGKAERADADLVQSATGYSIGGVSPIGHSTRLPMVIDQSLERFEVIYAAAGHPYCVFGTTLDELCRLTDAKVHASVTEC